MTQPAAVIEVEHLRKTFRSPLALRKVRAVQDVSFTVGRGQIFGFLGPNGAGKTTTIKVLTSLIQPSAGNVTVLGGKPTELKTRAKIGYLPETPNFYDYLTAREFLDIMARFYGLGRKARRKRVDEMLDMVGMTYAAKRKLRKFSKGMLQRIGIAQALIGDPELVILDEPMSGLDPIGRKDVRDIISSLKERGHTVFFSSHILSDIEMICDEVVVLNKGRAVTAGPLDELLRPGQLMTEILAQGDGSAEDISGTSLELEHRPGFLRLQCKPAEVDVTLQSLLQNGFTIRSVTEARIGLEDLLISKAFQGEAADD